tara:strand:- start:162 stop:794 length:633 start_codon:yes stop_codon:yes gene_type:complete
MAWPTAKPNNTSFDADSDRISDSRADLLTMSQAVNDIVDFIETNDIGDDKVLQYNSSTGKLEFVSPNTIGPVSTTQSVGVFFAPTLEIIATEGNVSANQVAVAKTVVVQHVGDPDTGYNFDIDLLNYSGNQKVCVVHDGESVDIASVNTRVLYNGTLITSMSSTPLGTSTVGEFHIIDTGTADSAGKNTYVKFHVARQSGATASGTEKVT